MNDEFFRLPSKGDVVGDYRIVGLLGEGGQGHVYRAEAFGRSFALKFLDRGLERCGEREVQTLLQLKHPGVVGLLGCGRWPDPEHGYFYVVMELVEGLTLYDYVMLHNPTARKVAELVLCLGRTLLAVQAAGVLHRDVKRENIMVRLPGEEPVVLDFGLAALAGASSSGGSRQVTGTLEYVSPEAWKHARDEEERYRPTAKDEQWALGVTFYWMLTDRIAFGERADPLMTRRVLREQPKAPHVLNPRVPPELGAVCMRLLEKNPESRYADLGEMCRELEQLLEASGGAESWEVPLGQPDAPECRTTDIDGTVLALQGIDLYLSKVRPPRRGRVRKRPETKVPEGPPPAPPPEPTPVPEVAAPTLEPAQVPFGSVGWRQRILRAVVLSALGVPPDWSSVRSAARRVAAWTLMLWLGFALQPAGEASTLAAWQVGNAGQEVASPPQSHESGPDAALTPASVVEATLPQGEPDVKTPQKKRGLRPLKRTAAAAAAALALGCPAAQVRSSPEPMECPPGAVENMEKLGLKLGESAMFGFESHEGGAAMIPVKEGWTSFIAYESWETKPRIKRLSGKLLFGERVYGRLTQATLSDGSTLKVCIELVGQNHFEKDLSLLGPSERGLPCVPTSSPDTVKVGSTVDVMPVDHFE